MGINDSAGDKTNHRNKQTPLPYKTPHRPKNAKINKYTELHYTNYYG
ncbi:hypothetical protein H1P_3640007 [Hyella patelloides LEGE 07179]|uniref:Uncharacterized protein n=1 Tax=Hyella patelloides LEGE 07179 TaxID=945734 RepID=A0A563VW96_9CYAN|nr:hypothetical protein H1P_3640007 [Hyella patelloides LEGE 07179]